MKNILLILALLSVSACFTDTSSGPTYNNASNNKNNTTAASNNNNSNNSNNTIKTGTTVACVPSSEICDQIDNNCDGNIDEGLPDCCFSANDCSDGKTCSADHKCVSCDDVNVCTGADASRCEASSCAACVDSTDCSHLADTLFCTNGVCRACSENADCTNGAVCDLDQLVCTKCVTDAECGGDKCLVDVVDATKNDCVTCLANDECPASETSKCSDANICESCAVDADCSHLTGLSFCRNDKCNECEVNADCSNSEKCHPTELVCTPCLVNADCGNDKCLIDQADAANNTCVLCLDNLSCTDIGTSKCGATNTCEACGIDADCAHLSDTTKCVGNVCVACTNDSTCNGMVCNTLTNKCSSQVIGAGRQCDSCVASSFCGIFLDCVPTIYDGNPAGNFCLTNKVANLNICPAPQYSFELGSYCGVKPELTSCHAVRGFDRICAGNNDCKWLFQDVGGVCLGANFPLRGYCSFSCDNDNQCPSNSTCVNTFCTKS